MLSPPEEPVMQSQETLSVSEEGTLLESEEVERRERSMEDLARRQKAKIDSQKADIFKLRNSRKRYERKYRGVREQVAELAYEFGKASKAHEETLERRDKRCRAVEDELTKTKELLAARSIELSTARSFLSIADGLSETEVLEMVHALNEHVFQVAANLVEEWEKLGQSQPDRFVVPRKKIDNLSQLYGHVLVHKSLDGDLGAVEFLVRSCIYTVVTQITSSWRHDRGVDPELELLGSIYKRLSVSGRCTPRTAVKFRLTHTRGAKNLS
jgi:hypothetical protein